MFHSCTKPKSKRGALCAALIYESHKTCAQSECTEPPNSLFCDLVFGKICFSFQDFRNRFLVKYLNFPLFSSFWTGLLFFDFAPFLLKKIF